MATAVISGQAYVKRSPQELLKDYLQFELYHSIGSYSVARDGFAALEEEMRQARGASGEDAGDGDKLLHVTRLAREYNNKLARRRHWAGRSGAGSAEQGPRHPIPDGLPLTLVERFEMEDDTPAVIDARRNPWASPVAWAWAVNFYEAAVVAIEIHEGTRPRARDKPIDERRLRLASTFAESVIWTRDRSGGLRSRDSSDEKKRMASRKQRFESRCKYAFKHLPGVERDQPLRSGDPIEFLHRIATDNLSSTMGSVPLFVIAALSEAHLSMHAIEGWQSMSFGAHAERAMRKDPWPMQVWLEQELDRCIALNTFAYCAGRTAPWIFAEDERECEMTFKDFSHAWDDAVPTRCMWIAAQVSLLALHRRAFCYALKGMRKESYNDYYKLQRCIRDTRRRVDQAPIHIGGAPQFLTALNARAHQNVGELYRSEHAHRPARKHYRMAIESLRGLGDDDRGEMAQVLVGSRWYVQLLLSQGKASYEMGRHKDSLRWHLLAWCAFLKLVADDTDTEASTDAIDQATAWLEEIKLEPELRKREVREKLRAVVRQLDRIQVSERLGALAADILLRLGHVLLVLDLDPDPAAQEDWVTDVEEYAGKGIVETLSFACLKKAAECDPHNTLAAADVLKSYFRTARTLAGIVVGDFPEDLKRKLGLPKMARIADHWPRGGDDYEQIDRAAEYLMLRALDPSSACGGDGDDAENLKIATDLLLSFFMHTDSIEVRKAQSHNLLMKPDNTSTPPGIDGDAAIELVCMRRYSSAFPLLPRPSAFRAHGGGYFLRLHAPRLPGRSSPRARDATNDGRSYDQFGIVVDPGPDFVENLYRTGFSLTDIDLIIVTHDHVDHLNSLESILSLLHYRSELLLHQKELDADLPADQSPSPLVYGNESVCKRYRDISLLNRGGERFRDIRELAAGGWRPKSGRFAKFDLLSMTSEVDGIGHLDLSEQPSHGICCRHGDLSIAITSDTPAPPSNRETAAYGRWLEKWNDALNADVLVAHLSTVPPAELRQLARLDARLVIERDDIDELSATCGRVCELAKEARGRLREIRQEQRSREADRSLSQQERLELARELLVVESVGGRVKLLRGAILQLQESADDLAEKVDSGPSQPLAEAIERVERRATALEGQVPQLHRDAASARHRKDLADLLEALASEAQRLAIEARDLPREATRLEQVREQLQSADPDLRGRIEFAMWLRSRKPGPPADLTGLVPSSDSDATKHWRPPLDHPYVRGALDWARAYRDEREGADRSHGSAAEPPLARGLFVLGELSEELGTARSKIAERVNETIFRHGTERGKGIYALTSDVGLRVVVVPRKRAAREHDAGECNAPRATSAPNRAGGRARILCTTCDLDNDRIANERYHPPHEVFEVCVKGENEGIFYNCRYHNPVNQPEPLFLEQLERFDVFGR